VIHERVTTGSTILDLDTKITTTSTISMALAVRMSTMQMVGHGSQIYHQIFDGVSPYPIGWSDGYLSPLNTAQRALLLGVRHVFEHGLQTLKTDQVLAFIYVDDLDTDVLLDAFDADWALGVGRVGGVGVRQEVGVFGHEGVETRRGRYCGVGHAGKGSVTS
jgi:hypothetical protein